MRRILGATIAAGALVLTAAAQDDMDAAKIKLQNMAAMAQVIKQDDMDAAKIKLQKMAAEAQVIRMEGGVMGPTVKNAPYSADEIHETNQTLGDGTRIHNQSKTTIYRDSEGRVRRENENEITIWDPVAGAQYMLNPKTMTGRKMGMNVVVTKTGTTPNDQVMITLDKSVQDINALQLKLKTAQEKMTVEGKQTAQSTLKKESLGTQMMEGVNADGVRVTTTIDAGAIGNDRPIQSITERWYSSELQTTILTRRDDPRTGENIVKLTNVQRAEPSRVLFEVPPGYAVK